MIFIIGFVICSIGMTALLSDRFNVRLRALFGAERIVAKCGGEWWSAIVMTDPWGCKVAYRYPAYRIGPVYLNDDGTGTYHGSPVVWKKA